MSGMPEANIQVEDDVKRELFAVAAELQSKLGRRVSLSEAIKFLLEAYRTRERDAAKMLSLFGCLGQASEARRVLRELRAGEEKDLGLLARKHDTLCQRHRRVSNGDRTWPSHRGVLRNLEG